MIKKVLLINGSPNEHGCTDVALLEAAASLNKNGIETEILWLGKQPMQDCIACYQCRQKGKCVFDDQVNEIAARLDEFGGMIVGSPVYYGGPNGRLTSFLDRLFFSADGTKFRGMLAASVVSCRRGGATAAFERLNQYFLMTNMHVVSSQYWNQIYVGGGALPGKSHCGKLHKLRGGHWLPLPDHIRKTRLNSTQLYFPHVFILQREICFDVAYNFVSRYSTANRV